MRYVTKTIKEIQSYGKGCKEKMTTKQLIQEYVDDHYNNFGFYPYDVEVDGMIFSYGNYWSILEDDRFE